MTTITAIGLALAKKVFHVHGVVAEGKVVVARKLRRKEVLAFFAKLPPCLVSIEACGSAHYWGREIAKLGVRERPALVGLDRHRAGERFDRRQGQAEGALQERRPLFALITR
jgi:transposase